MCDEQLIARHNDWPCQRLAPSQQSKGKTTAYTWYSFSSIAQMVLCFSLQPETLFLSHSVFDLCPFKDHLYSSRLACDVVRRDGKEPSLLGSGSVLFYNYTRVSVRFGCKMSFFLHCKIAYTTQENVKASEQECLEALSVDHKRRRRCDMGRQIVPYCSAGNWKRACRL